LFEDRGKLSLPEYHEHMFTRDEHFRRDELITDNERATIENCSKAASFLLEHRKNIWTCPRSIIPRRPRKNYKKFTGNHLGISCTVREFIS